MVLLMQGEMQKDNAVFSKANTSVVISRIKSLLEETKGKDSFLDVLFGASQKAVLEGKSIILFGGGALGKEMLYALQHLNIFPAAFCDNNTSVQGKNIKGLPVISPEQLRADYPDSFVIICISKHEDSIAKQLIKLGVNSECIFRKESNTTNKLIAMYTMVGTQASYWHHHERCLPDSMLQRFMQMSDKLDEAYECYQDQYSKDVFVYKLAIFASGLHFWLFKQFMLLYSEPCHEFGVLGYDDTPEDYYYFNNDVFNIDNGEIYLDVGAYDGDTVLSFITASQKQDVAYKEIIAIEPDPSCFDLLVSNTKECENTSIHQVGLWYETSQINFLTSEETIHAQAGNITTTVDDRTVTINVHRLDDFLEGEKVTFIKMDPSGDIVRQVLMGGEKTIRTHKPKLALGIYHSLEEFIDIPILLKEWCPEYKLFLRHNTYHLSDTDLYAHVG